MDNALNKRFVFGVGSGRSGTLSLANILNNQTGASVSHEFRVFSEEGTLTPPHRKPLPWYGSQHEVDSGIATVGAYPGELVGDVASFWLPHLEHVIDSLPMVRVVGLWRPRDEVVSSFERHVHDKNHWMEHDGTVWRTESNWDRAFPSFDSSTRPDAIGQYWDLYYKMLDSLVARFPSSVRVWPMDALNNRGELGRILEFAGISTRHQRITVSLHRNRSRRTVTGMLREVRRRVMRY